MPANPSPATETTTTPVFLTFWRLVDLLTYAVSEPSCYVEQLARWRSETYFILDVKRQEAYDPEHPEFLRMASRGCRIDEVAALLSEVLLEAELGVRVLYVDPEEGWKAFDNFLTYSGLEVERLPDEQLLSGGGAYIDNTTYDYVTVAATFRADSRYREL